MSFIGHAEVGDDDVVRAHFRSNVGHCELACHDAATFDWPVLLFTDIAVTGHVLPRFVYLLICSSALLLKKLKINLYEIFGSGKCWDEKQCVRVNK